MTNTKTILNFLEELSENNEIAWLHQHQEVRDKAIKEFESPDAKTIILSF